jgi:FixJ family two-component response regulator
MAARSVQCGLGPHVTATLPLVAVVEDDQSTLKGLGRVLRAGGYEPAAYSSAEEFLSAPPLRPPICLVLDVKLGGMSGLELLRRLRAIGSTLAVIFMTGVEDSRVHEEAARLGSVGVLSKGCDAEILLDLIREQIPGGAPPDSLC